jgi:hypothetical protein
MGFLTKLDYSNNRQIKQNIETNTHLSGGTVFGVPFSQLPSGIDTSSTGISETYVYFSSTFSGNSGTTIYNWAYPIMSIGEGLLSAITPSNSALTQTVDLYFSANTTTVIDGNTIALTYTGVSYDINVTGMTVDGSGNYSGSVLTTILHVYSGNSLDYKGRTIWVDVSGITRTNDLIINKSPNIGYVWTCLDNEGKGNWQSVSGGTSLFSAGTGVYSIATINDSAQLASGGYSLSLGNATIASGDSSFAIGKETTAGGLYSFVNGYQSTASGSHSFANGYQVNVSGSYSFVNGIANIVDGDNSFVHGQYSSTNGFDSVIILGGYITATQSTHTYVNSLNIQTVGSGAFVNDIRIDGSGFLTTNTSDERLKENINPISNSLNKIKQMSGVTYEWIDKVAGGDRPRYGFIAQQIESVDTLLIFTGKTNGYKGIHTDCIIPIIVEAIKELSSGNTSVNNVNINTQTIIAEDNNIELNYNGTHQTAIGGGLVVLSGIDDGNDAELTLNKDGNWITNNSFIPKELIIPNYTPTSSSDENGNIGSITIDDNYLYIKTNNNWRRINLERF